LKIFNEQKGLQSDVLIFYIPVHGHGLFHMLAFDIIVLSKVYIHIYILYVTYILFSE